jgi:ribosomal protein S11
MREIKKVLPINKLMKAKSTGSKQLQPTKTKLCPQGILHLSYRKNSVFITLTDLEGKVLASLYSVTKFKKNIELADYMLKELSITLRQVLKQFEIRLLVIKIKGQQTLKVRRLLFYNLFRKRNKGIKIRSFTFIENQPHNGCRPQKVRRR